MSWSTGLYKKHHSGSEQKEGHAGKDMHCLYFYIEQAFHLSCPQTPQMQCILMELMISSLYTPAKKLQLYQELLAA